MEWVLLGVVVAGAVVAGLVLRRPTRAPVEPTPPSAELLEMAEIEARFAEVLGETGEVARSVLHHRLDLLRRRGVPLRAIHAATGLPGARLCFADGTVVLTRPHQPDVLLDVAIQLHRRPVVLAAWAEQEELTALILEWGSGEEQQAELLAVGLDQED